MFRPVVRALALPIALVVLWWASGRFWAVSPILLPPPESVVRAFIDLGASGVLFLHIFTSLGRVLAGFAIAAGVAVPLGLLLGTSKTLEQFSDGLLSILRPIPPFAWIPLAILWFGIGNGATIFVVTYAAFFPILINTIAGVRGIETSHLRVASSIGAKGLLFFWHVIIPASFPMIMTGLRVGLGIAWMSIVAGELVAAQSGLGFMIMFYRSLFITENVLVGMITIGALGLAVDRLMGVVELRMTPWRQR